MMKRGAIDHTTKNMKNYEGNSFIFLLQVKKLLI